MLEEPGPTALPKGPIAVGPLGSAGVMPPRVYAPSPVQEAYNPHISDPHFRTLLQVRGLAHLTGGDRTPPLTLEELGALRGISRLMLCRHLQALRTGGYLRIEPSGANAFVIYPRRWKPGSGLPARPERGRGRLTPMERTLLFGNAGHDTAIFKHEEILEHVVVESQDSHPETLELLHDHGGAFFKNEDEQTELAQELAGAMIAHRMEPDAAWKKAHRLLAEFGLEVCIRQVRVFERRCELARAGRGGLRNPIGMLYLSIKEDWPLPAEKDEKQTKRWYTDEEFEQFFEH
jgi:hypothetical protein